MTVPTNADLIALGQAVRHLRQERHLTIEALASRSSMHPTYLSSIERGLRNPTLVKLVGLAGPWTSHWRSLPTRRGHRRDSPSGCARSGPRWGCYEAASLVVSSWLIEPAAVIDVDELRSGRACPADLRARCLRQPAATVRAHTTS